MGRAREYWKPSILGKGCSLRAIEMRPFARSMIALSEGFVVVGVAGQHTLFSRGRACTRTTLWPTRWVAPPLGKISNFCARAAIG